MRRTVCIAVLAAMVGALVAAPVAVYASHQFTDVPNTNPFHDDIGWLADAGVTLGCGPNVYCPKDNVTREQMAAFMHRLADSQEVDAGELDGFQAEELAPRAAYNFRNDLSSGDFTLSTQITAPAAGLLVMSGGVNAANGTEKDSYLCSLFVNGGYVLGTDRTPSMNGDVGVSVEGNCSTTGVQAVGAGTHTIDLKLSDMAATTNHNTATVWAIWIPFDGTGDKP